MKRGPKPTGNAMSGAERQRRYLERTQQAQAREHEELATLRAEAEASRIELKELRAELKELRSAQVFGSLAGAVSGFERTILTCVAEKRKEPESAVAQALLAGVLPCLVPSATAAQRAARIEALLKRYTLR